MIDVSKSSFLNRIEKLAELYLRIGAVGFSLQLVGGTIVLANCQSTVFRDHLLITDGIVLLVKRAVRPKNFVLIKLFSNDNGLHSFSSC